MAIAVWHEVSGTGDPAVLHGAPDARLAVLPGTHALPIEAAAATNALVIDFLRNGPPATLWDALR